MTAFTLKRTITGLVAADDAAAEMVRKIPVGETVRAEITRERSHRNLRRWWALVKMVYENSEQFKSPEMVHEYIKIRAGHCQQIVSPKTGEVFLIADSISFGRMDEIDFMDFWRRAIAVVCDEIIPGLKSADVEDEILRLCGLAA